MAVGKAERQCTVVLHDDRVSREDVLCGVDILPEGKVGILSAKDARPLCVLSKARAAGQKEVSLNIDLGKRFGFENRMSATLTLVVDTEDIIANHVEFFFRDICLSRADMWQMVRSLNGGTIYKDQQIRYLGSQTAVAGAIYINGQEADSALFLRPKTKTIWRSGSARFTLLIQISEEMLERWNDGQLMYERLIEGYLIELFKRWESLKMRHHFSIVLFGRGTGPEKTIENELGESSGNGDFFQLLCDDTPTSDWPQVIQTLKRVFNSTRMPRQVSLAAQGNMLEAIYLAALDNVNDYVDPQFSSTGTSIIAITAGAAFFDSDHALLKRTTNLLLGNSIGVDVVALSPKPLHPTPLFKYKLGQDFEYALPHWADVSYWKPHSGQSQKQMMLLPMEGVSSVILKTLSQDAAASNSPTMAGIMDSFDADQLRDSISPATPSIEGQGLVVSTSVESARTLTDRVSSLRNIQKPAAPIKSHKESELPVKPSRPPSTVLRPGKESAMHPLLHTGRKVSVGLRGLAPMTGTASTTISTDFAGQSKETPLTAFTPNESSSGLAKQIRASLARKSSQQSLVSQPATEQTKATKPINIQSAAFSAISEDSMSDDSHSEATSHDLAEDKQSSPHLSRTPKPFPSLGSLPVLEAQDLAQQALTPWLTLLNPCNPRRDNMRIANQYRKWHHVFPKAIETGAFKWDSMCSPAALPLSTDVVPTARELDKHYDRKNRRLVLSGFTDSSAESKRILRKLISIRLARGFQIVARQTKAGTSNSIALDGPVLMSIGTLYHEIEINSNFELQVIEYNANTHSDLMPEPVEAEIKYYTPRIGSLSGSKLSRCTINLASNPPGGDWASLDHAMVDNTLAPDANPMSRMRLVLIPAEFSRPENDGGTIRSRDLSDEERRTDGIQIITQLWQRHRVFTTEDQNHQVSLARPKTSTTNVDRDPNPLAIDFQTRDPSAIVNTQDTSLAGHLADDGASAPLFAESEMYHSSNFDVSKLVKQMQEPPPHGVEVRDRRWFTRMHLKCFRGDELTNWLLGVFKNLVTREDAVAIGNMLMDRGIFNHVRGRHAFRDGNYFYQIAGLHRTTEYPDTAGFFAKGLGRSVPPTPIIEARFSPLTKAMLDNSESSSNSTPSAAPLEKKQIVLSQVIQYNMDATHKSDQKEIVNLHCDRIHNPENCYHIQLDWLTATPRLIREAITRWNTLAESHGLKLVQLSVIEASKQHLMHPFDRPHQVRLACAPPEKAPVTPHLIARSPMRSAEDPTYYYKAILRKSGFVLDLEAASSFSSKLDVTYSWGRPDYEMTQFVHRTGTVLAQICNDDLETDFLLLPNRLAPSKLGTAMRYAESGSADEVMKEFKAFCGNEKALRALYAEAYRPRVSAPSPFSSATLAGSDVDVPPMQLPPHLLQRVLS